MSLPFQKKTDDNDRHKMKAYFQGLGMSFPIVLGYFPVAIAFGLAAKGAGFSFIGAGLISLFVFAGASQFALVGMIAGGTPIMVASIICLALNARHAVYGPSLSAKFKSRDNHFLPLVSFGLTDEVFSTALSELEKVDSEKQMSWLLGLETGAYFTWVFASFLGAFSGDFIIGLLPAFKTALSFALPSLFLTLLVLMIDRKTIVPVLFSAFVAGLVILSGFSNYSIPAASVAGPVMWLFLRRFSWT